MIVKTAVISVDCHKHTPTTINLFKPDLIGSKLISMLKMYCSVRLVRAFYIIIIIIPCKKLRELFGLVQEMTGSLSVFQSTIEILEAEGQTHDETGIIIATGRKL